MSFVRLLPRLLLLEHFFSDDVFQCSRRVPFVERIALLRAEVPGVRPDGLLLPLQTLLLYLLQACRLHLEIWSTTTSGNIDALAMVESGEPRSNIQPLVDRSINRRSLSLDVRVSCGLASAPLPP